MSYAKELKVKREKLKLQLPSLLADVSKRIPSPKSKPSHLQTTYMQHYSKPTSYTLEQIISTYDKSKPSDKTKTTETKIDSKLPPLKQVIYPPDLIADFIDKAEKNTKNNIETCGILCGKRDDAFVITHIYIPEQKGTPDMCITLNYENIQKYVSNNKLIVIGWIHTHPEYTCFLSSVDVHTQYSYQKLLPESIAVVYSGLKLPSAEK